MPICNGGRGIRLQLPFRIIIIVVWNNIFIRFSPDRLEGIIGENAGNLLFERT
jgi:hypothetical protein